jgi:tetratricopeptide (TPR) repeat protein
MTGSWRVKTIRILVATIALCLASPAAAGDPEERTAAEQFFRLGAEAYRSGKFDVAATNFDSAYAHLKAPEIAFSAAQAHRLQYQSDRDPARLNRAMALYKAYLDGAPDGARRKDALVYLDRLDGALKQIDPAQLVAAQQKPSIYVSIAIDRAQVTVDGKAAEPNTPIEVPPGEHVVAATADGYFPQERRIRVGAGLAPVPFELAARPATLAIKSQPDVRITVDGRPVLLRGMATEVAAGKRWITVSARGRRPVSREVMLGPGQQLTLDAPLQVTAQRRAVRWVVVGAGALLAGTIATTGIAIAADFSAADLRDREPLLTGDAAAYEQDRTRRDRFRTASFVLGSAALATAAVAAVMYYVDEPSPDALLRPIEQAPDAGFTPLALGGGLGGGLGLGLGYTGGF